MSINKRLYLHVNEKSSDKTISLNCLKTKSPDYFTQKQKIEEIRSKKIHEKIEIERLDNERRENSLNPFNRRVPVRATDEEYVWDIVNKKNGSLDPYYHYSVEKTDFYHGMGCQNSMERNEGVRGVDIGKYVEAKNYEKNGDKNGRENIKEFSTIKKV